ncbi:hypothetical protein BD289DRAFT_168851 [Coniella lustricola]|uniref:Uncharacterized protein n=1 Tax=Coniella lustricola TaxID=2025994 RepID=A0A2T2ZTZ9_9PEZI|nr:hypothetical protein BD289DRAFT_168851 [Coniella lustricola]
MGIIQRRSARQAERSVAAPTSEATHMSNREGIDRRRTFAPPAPASTDEKIQTLLKLPGFCWEEDLHWIFPRDNRHILRMLGVEIISDGISWRPADDQRLCTARVADMIEICNDEWLDNWQECDMSADFWEAATERLVCFKKWWGHMAPNSQHVYKIVMTYAGRCDPKGCGEIKDEGDWGFSVGDLTWGDRKAEIDLDWRAKSWDYDRA